MWFARGASAPPPPAGLYVSPLMAAALTLALAALLWQRTRHKEALAARDAAHAARDAAHAECNLVRDAECGALQAKLQAALRERDERSAAAQLSAAREASMVAVVDGVLLRARQASG
jgi:hypothetical protein